jgi:hypothetical protein
MPVSACPDASFATAVNARGVPTLRVVCAGVTSMVATVVNISTVTTVRWPGTTVPPALPRESGGADLYEDRARGQVVEQHALGLARLRGRGSRHETGRPDHLLELVPQHDADRGRLRRDRPGDARRPPKTQC